MKGTTMHHCSIPSVLILIIAMAIPPGMSFSQEQSLKKKDVPKAIMGAFEKSYPKATIKGFSKETGKDKVVYEIESTEGDLHRDVSYAVDGSVVSVEESMSFKDLPEPVRSAFAQKYPKAKVISCEKVSEGSATQFELLLRAGKKKYEVVFNADGSIAEKEER